MDVHRVEGIKYDLDRLSDLELKNIHLNLLQHHARIVGEVALIEHKLFGRANDPIPFEDQERHDYTEISDPAVWQLFIEHTKDV